MVELTKNHGPWYFDYANISFTLQRHLYEEDDLGPVEEIESDRQQRVYRGQPPTLGQVARDRDGIARHANALQVRETRVSYFFFFSSN